APDEKDLSYEECRWHGAGPQAYTGGRMRAGVVLLGLAPPSVQKAGRSDRPDVAKEHLAMGSPRRSAPGRTLARLVVVALTVAAGIPLPAAYSGQTDDAAALAQRIDSLLAS